MTLASRWVGVRDAEGNLTPEAEHRDIRAGLFSLMGEASQCDPIKQTNTLQRHLSSQPSSIQHCTWCPKFPKNWKTLHCICQEIQIYFQKFEAKQLEVLLMVRAVQPGEGISNITNIFKYHQYSSGDIDNKGVFNENYDEEVFSMRWGWR